MNIEEDAKQFMGNMEVLREADEALYLSLKNKEEKEKEVALMKERLELERSELLLVEKMKEENAKKQDERNALFEEHELIKF